jgi:hypothetical protein
MRAGAVLSALRPGGLRRTELVALDATEDDQGLRVCLRWSKTDQDGEGTSAASPTARTRAPAAVRSWPA